MGCGQGHGCRGRFCPLWAVAAAALGLRGALGLGAGAAWAERGHARKLGRAGSWAATGAEGKGGPGGAEANWAAEGEGWLVGPEHELGWRAGGGGGGKESWPKRRRKAFPFLD